jgi:type IV fimbrial biogenesis protein FimT
MKKSGLIKYYHLFSRSGFTLTEVLIVIALLAILTGFALPSFIEWRQNMYYKQAASEIANSLKKARSEAIKSNQLHGVKFVTADRSYQLSKFANSHWSYSSAKGFLPSNVILNIDGAASTAAASEPNISFDINGASFNNYSVRIKNANTSKYTVFVERSGRIKMTKVP